MRCLPRLLACFVAVATLAACGHSTSQKEGRGAEPLRTFTASDDSLVLACGLALDAGNEPFASARVFAGGTWELAAAAHSSAPRSVRYYEQARGETCRVETKDEWREGVGK